MADLARRIRIPRELPVAALVATAALPLSRLFRPGGFTGVVLSTVILATVLSWLCRRLRLPVSLSLLVSLVGLLWYIAARFYPNTLFIVFPTPSSISAISNGVHEGIQQTIDEAVPVVATSALLTFVAAGVWLSAWLADAAAVWVGNPLLAIAAAVPLLATPGTLAPSQRRWLDIGLFLAAAAWVLFADGRARAERARPDDRDTRLGWHRGPAARVALIGILIVVVGAPLIPGYGAPPVFRSRGPGQRFGFNPFIAIRPTLTQHPDVTLFTVEEREPTYLRLTTLSHFNGDQWIIQGSRATDPIGPEEIAPAEPSVPAHDLDEKVTIQALAGPWLPAAFDPVAIQGVPRVNIERDSRGLVTTHGNGLPTGTEYTVTSRVPVLTADLLDQPFSYDETAMSDYLELPGNVPSSVKSLAKSVAGAQPTPFRKAVALQDYLRTFTYDDTVSLRHSFRDIVGFLRTKRGYCEQFAATMAVMARTLGIPSRIAIGFGYGLQLKANEYRITTREAHAWVEIYFPSAGWVAFEPTPRSGVARVPAYATAGVGALPSVSASAFPSASPSANNPTTPGAEHGPAEDAPVQQKKPAGHFPWLVVGLAVGIVVLCAIGWFATFGPLRRRVRRVRDERYPAIARYVDFLGWCQGAGLGRHPGETPVEHAARLGEDVTSAILPLERLAALAGEALWSPPNGLDATEVASAARDARDALKDSISRPRRVLAASGWGRWRALD